MPRPTACCCGYGACRARGSSAPARPGATRLGLATGPPKFSWATPCRYRSTPTEPMTLPSGGGVAQRPEHQEVAHQPDEHGHQPWRARRRTRTPTPASAEADRDRDVEPVRRQEVDPGQLDLAVPACLVEREHAVHGHGAVGEVDDAGARDRRSPVRSRASRRASRARDRAIRKKSGSFTSFPRVRVWLVSGPVRHPGPHRTASSWLDRCPAHRCCDQGPGRSSVPATRSMPEKVSPDRHAGLAVPLVGGDVELHTATYGLGCVGARERRRAEDVTVVRRPPMRVEALRRDLARRRRDLAGAAHRVIIDVNPGRRSPW